MAGASLGRGLRFGLPPSLGWEPVKELARRFADLLFEAEFDTVIPYKSYEALQGALIGGEVEAAWAPPAVCARVEGAGGQVALRAIRDSSQTYRSALVVRAHDPLDLARLSRFTPRALRAVWVDRYSMGGYLLPRHYLRSHGVRPEEAFAQEAMLGSYQACIRELLDGEADITATFASQDSDAYIEYFSARPDQIRVLGFTEETPNDGIAVSPALDTQTRQRLLERLTELTARRSRRRILAQMFDVDDFDVPAVGTYRNLLVYL
jgi:phosphonate transport system substrate-binding protein